MPQHDIGVGARSVAPGGVLRVGIAVGPAASPVWATRGADGRPRGVTVDLGAAMAERLALPLQLVEHASSGEIIKAAASNRWDVAFTPVDAERKTMVLFGPDYALGRSTYMVPAGSPLRALSDVDQAGIRVAGVENTATIRSARRSLSANTVRGIVELDKAMALFRAGEIDALAIGEDSIRSMLPLFPGARMFEESFHSTGTAVAVPLGADAALAVVSALIEEMKRDGTVRRAFDAHGMENTAVAPLNSRS